MLRQMTNSRLILLGILFAASTYPTRGSETTHYRMVVKNNIVSLRIPSDWAQLPRDPDYVYFATANQRQKITFYVRPAKEVESPEQHCENALHRLRRLQRDVNRTGKSCLRDLSKGPKLRLSDGIANASWMYRIIKPTSRGGTQEIRYWTIVTRYGELDYYLELRWEPDLKEEKDDHLSFMEKFCKAFEPICNTLRIEHDAVRLPIAILVQRKTP